ncbi:hypothetical protein RJ640_017974 [Escallonia rubra]|uniref:UspA domain-containing protein n=1 Tax=Escallonia rubra TaxID=112253 RepID=A0AA88R7V8_9ASTE|nr:hypothetical protein RJ640_017974 [Escallonia rubra]
MADRGRGGDVEKMDRVMIAIDESDTSHYALDWALQNLGESLAKSHVVIFTVQRSADYDYIQGSSVTPVDLIRNLLETQRKVAAALLDKAATVSRDAGVVVETSTEVGDPKMTICDAVERLNVDLLVVGTHGRGNLDREVLHSKGPMYVGSRTSRFRFQIQQGYPGNGIQNITLRFPIPDFRFRKAILEMLIAVVPLQSF